LLRQERRAETYLCSANDRKSFGKEGIGNFFKVKYKKNKNSGSKLSETDGTEVRKKGWLVLVNKKK